MEKDRDTRRNGFLKQKYPGAANDRVSPPRKMFKTHHDEIKDENPYQEFPSSDLAKSAGSQASPENDVEWTENVPKGCSEEGKSEASITWQEFKAKMLEHKSLFQGSLKNFGRKSNQYVVRVAKGSKEDALDIIRSNITANIDKIVVVEMVEGQGTIRFLGSKPIKSGRRIVNVATKDFRRDTCLQSGLAGTLTLLMEDTKQKYYGVAPGHVFIEEFEKDMLTKMFKSFPFECYRRTVVCEVEPAHVSQRIIQILAQEVYAGIETFETGFMDCGWFKVDDTNMNFLDFGLENIDNPPQVCMDESICGRDVCKITSLGSSAVAGVIVEEDVYCFLGKGEDNALLCEVFYVEGNDHGCFAYPGNSGNVVHDKQGNVFGMVIASDTTMQGYPGGVTICIRFDQMLKYIESKGGLKLQIVQQPVSASTGDVDHQDQTASCSSSSDVNGKKGETGRSSKEHSSKKGEEEIEVIAEMCKYLEIKKKQAKTPEDEQEIDQKLKEARAKLSKHQFKKDTKEKFKKL